MIKSTLVFQHFRRSMSTAHGSFAILFGFVICDSQSGGKTSAYIVRSEQFRIMIMLELLWKVVSCPIFKYYDSSHFLYCSWIPTTKFSYVFTKVYKTIFNAFCDNAHFHFVSFSIIFLCWEEIWRLGFGFSGPSLITLLWLVMFFCILVPQL